MSGERTTLSAAVDRDSELAKQFDQFREANGMTSKSEAVRHLVRAGLAQQEYDDGVVDGDDAGAGDDQPPQPSPASQQIDILSIDGIKPLAAGVAFIIGSDGFLAAAQSVAGDFAGSWIFITVGIVILASLLPMLKKGILDRLPGSDDDDDDAADSAGAQA